MTSTKELRRVAALEKAFLDMDLLADQLIRQVARDPRYADTAAKALAKAMAIKKRLLEAVQ